MDVIRLCRLCLTFSEYHANIFFDKIKDKEMWRLINSVCELNTFLYDGLPEHICVDCVYTLKKTLSFRNRAIEATSALKLMIQRNKDLWEKSEFDAWKSSKATPKAVQVETPQGTKAVVQPVVATPPSIRCTTVNKVLSHCERPQLVPTEVEIDIGEGQIPKEWKRESMDTEVSGVGSVTDASPKKSKRLRSPGKNNQCKNNPPSPGRSRTVKVETPSCEDNKQGPSSKKDRMQQSLSEHQSGAENKAARPFVCQQCGASYIRKHFLQKHELTHRNNWNCITCNLRLRSKRDLNSHMQFYSHIGPNSTRSSDLKNDLSLDASEETARNSLEGESSSSCSSQDIEIRDTNKTINEKDLRVDVVQEEESAGPLTSILNDTKSELSHLKAPLSKSTFVCDICKKSFERKWDMIRHVRVHNDQRPFSCNICDKKFKQDSNRRRHELRHVRYKISFGNSKKRQYSCTVCGKNFSIKSCLYRHSIKHSNKYKCNSCGRRFCSNMDLSRHSSTHTKEKPFKCEVCLKCFAEKGSLNRHLRSHSSDTPFPCEICDMRFESKALKSEHKLIHFRKKWKKCGFTCDVCKKRFKVIRDLGNHVRVHNDERPFSCNVCDKTFKWDSARNLHELTHVRDKIKFGKSEKEGKKNQFSCTVCGKNFETKRGLKFHLNQHRGKYKCDSCGKCFGHSLGLRRHLITHTKERPFKCEVCSKCFQLKTHLNRHLSIHSSEKPFSCDFCDKRFKLKGAKADHELRHFRKK